jgi:protein SCO1/2
VIRSSLLVVALLSLPHSAAAHEQAVPSGEAAKKSGYSDPGDEILPPPPTYKANDVTVIEKLGGRVPLDAKFRRQDGNVVRLGDVLAAKRAGGAGPTGGDELPAILTFNYSDCPMLCNLQLSGLTTALPALTAYDDVTKTNLHLGEHYRIITISLEPDEDMERLVKMREKYLARFPESQREAARAGWTFLVAEHPGDASAIKSVAETVGFSYVYVKERAEWAHPASIILLSSRGMVTRYVHGVEFAPEVLRESILRAGASEPSTAVGFMNRCYHFDPDANNHSQAGVMALRIGAAGFVVLLLSGLGMLHVIRKKGQQVSEKGNQ